MKRLKTICLIAISMMSAGTAYAGGLLTNTNQNIAFNRNFARDGVIAIDGVYSNPAGVAFLDNGFHLSFNVQNVYQTRTINSGITVPALQGTPFYQPFKMNGGDENGVKKYRGTASVPVLPSIQAALNYDHWGFQASFAFVGGGGQCTFNNGLASFERSAAMIPALLYQQGLNTDPTKAAYSLNSYMSGQQYIFGFQLGVTYKFNEHVAVYGGGRFNYVWNKYEGNIRNISSTINGEKMNLYNYFGEQAETFKNMAFYYKMRSTEMTDATQKATYEAMAQQYAQGASKMNQTKEQFADKYLDCSQYGWSITPIIGADFRYGNLNIGTRLEFTTHFNIENHTKIDDTGLFQDGVNTPGDQPGIFSLGAQYSVLPSLRVMGSWHYYFDKDAEMANDKQKTLKGNTQEYLAGVEWDATKDLTVSCGGQITDYKFGNGEFLSDMSFLTSSYSFGFGLKYKIAKKVSVNVAYFFTDYKHFKKDYTSEIQGTEVKCTDDFTRTNKVLGAGIDIDF